MKSGILIINKPAGMTSHDVVDEIRRMTSERRVGHAGTLDPFATGVLVVGVGREATRALGGLSRNTEKRYRATVRLGAESDTYDRDGAIVEHEEAVPPKRTAIVAALRQFVGAIQQRPPVYSSVKVGGVPAHRRTRRGEAVELEPRSVTVHSIALQTYQWPNVVMDVTCSSGTYVRSLAHDLGQKLGVGAYLEALERTAVGTYTTQQAHTLEEISQGIELFLLPIPTPHPSPFLGEGSRGRG